MNDAYLERIARASEEQVKWTRFLAMPRLKELVDQTLKTEEEKLVYELSDGERSTRDIEKVVAVSRTRVSTLWAKWYKLHIMERSEKYGGKRMKRVFSLAEAGLDVPPMPGGQETLVTTKEEFD